MLRRVPSRLPDELETIVHRTIGSMVAVHRGLGPGLLESIYARAAVLELAAAGLAFEREKSVPVFYRNELLCHHRLDIVVEHCVLIELKAVERLLPVHYAQTLTYLRVAHLPVGLLVNFNVPVLQAGLKRIVL
jgi:GxxExxY protein